MGYCGSRRDFPPFSAQLGCQGLVIFDHESCISVGCSPSLNRVGLKAFRTVDAVVVTLAEDAGMDECDLVAGESRVYESAQDLQEELYESSMRASERRAQERACAVPPEKRYEANVGAGNNSKTNPSSSDSSAKACPNCPPCPPDKCEAKEARREKPLGVVPSVGHDEMDEEHAACAQAFERLRVERTVESLRDLISLLQYHFEHEEALMQESGFGAGAPAGLSPLESHKTDHKRILEFAESELQQARRKSKGGSAGQKLVVSETCAQSIANLFEVHATQFDSRYEGVVAGK